MYIQHISHFPVAVTAVCGADTAVCCSNVRGDGDGHGGLPVVHDLVVADSSLPSLCAPMYVLLCLSCLHMCIPVYYLTCIDIH